MSRQTRHGTDRQIEIRGARVNNLRNVSLDVPKERITVFTGVSGSGKSSLVFGTIAAESQRLVNDAYPPHVQAVLPHYGRPEADSLAHLSVAIVVDQQRMGGTPRSTLGTATDTYALLRLLFARAGTPRTPDPRVFSFNDPQGMCRGCEGLGEATGIDVEALVDRDKTLNTGGIRFPAFAVGSAHWNFFVSSGLFDNDRKLADFTEDEWRTLLHGEPRRISVVNGGKTSSFTYEGVVPKFRRLFLAKGAERIQARLRDAYDEVVTTVPCTQCEGTRIGPAGRACLIDGVHIGQCLAMQVSDLAELVRGVDAPQVAPVVADLVRRLDGLTALGLGYLSLDRRSATLSGGESQRVKVVRHLGSGLTDVTYVLDEPTTGLHPYDVHRLNDLLRQLRDKGNTVLVVEHDPEVMAIADRIVDLGPGAGAEGGEVVYEGDFAGLAGSGTLTGRHLARPVEVKTVPRRATGSVRIPHARLHNLRDVTVELPLGVLTVVTGVAGSGKSSLIGGCLPRVRPDAVHIDQSLPRGSRRSNAATYTGLMDPLRKAFAAANGVSPALFSSNSEGACPQCQGLGVVYTELAHLDPVATTCELCEGRRFSAPVLRHRLRGRTVNEVLGMSVLEALEFCTEPEIAAPLACLRDVGLGYVTLWQPVSTFSGGERQRLKLANELGRSGRLYVLDEPTAGLHMADVEQLVALFDRLVDNGGTVVVIEHNLEVVARADWVVDLGPGAGHDGGRVVYEGPPEGLLTTEGSRTGEFLRRRGAAR